MKNQNDIQINTTILRQKAEEQLQNKTSDSISLLSESDVLKLIHELEVHQIELEMQNEELVLAIEKAELAGEKYTDLYDFAPSGYISLSKEDEIIQLNFAAAGMLGAERGNLINKNFILFVSLNTRSIFSRFLKSIYSSKVKQTCEIIIATEGNLPIYIDVVGIASPNNEMCFLTVTDITERKQNELSLKENNDRIGTQKYNLELFNIEMQKAKEKAEENESKFKIIACSTPDHIIVQDMDLRYTFVVNPQLGLTEQDMIGKTDYDFLDFNDAENITIIKRTVLNTGETVYSEVPLLNSAGEQEYFIGSYIPKFDGDGNINGLIGYFTNVTEKKKIELELIKAKERAEESDRFKTAFLQNMSHEIRTPLNGILGFSNLLAEEDISKEEIKEFTHIITQCGKRLLETINNVIDISKIETGQIEVQKTSFQINSLISDLYMFFVKSTQAKGISLNYRNTLEGSNSIIKTDESKLNQILINLINNAIKFTSSGSIDFGYEINDNNILFFVKDTGIGVPLDKIDKIFERFIQGDISLTRGYEGSGLGLAISKGLVELLGGKIWLESEVNIGSSFYFTIPVAHTEAIKAEKQTTQNVLKNKIVKILIAEDDWTNYQYLNRILSKLNCILFWAATGKAAIDIINSEPDIDLILMDIKMPVMDGFEATKQIKKTRPNLPIIAQTAYAFSEEREKILSAGCDDYLSKPIAKESLLELLKKYIN